MDKFDLAVIGSGPGGYVAAIRAAQKGLKVVCFEKEKNLGGTCLNIGCIPSKALLHSTEYYHRIQEQGHEHGIEAVGLKFDLSKMMARKSRIVEELASGVLHLFKKNRVTQIQAAAKLLSPTTIQAADKTIEATSILLATGSEPIALPFLPFDEKNVLSSTGALRMQRVPKKMIVVGAGVIGLELGSVFQRLGAEVVVIELLDRVAPGLDKAISKEIQQILERQGFVFHLNRRVSSAVVENAQVHLEIEKQGTMSADVVLVAIGRRPYHTELGIENVGIRQDSQGRVIVDQNFCTTVPNIYAIGDLIDGPMLAHKASQEAVAVVDLILGEKISVNYLAIPNVMYTWPEVACVGMTEEEAGGLDLAIGKISFKAIGRARCAGDMEGFVKIIGEKKSRRLIGLHIIGPNASEMIHEGVIAIENRLTIDQLAHTAHAHPTCSEAIKEAALMAIGQAIHI